MDPKNKADFDAAQAELEKLRASPKGRALLQAVEAFAKEAASGIADAARVLAPVALEVGREALISFAKSSLESELSKLAKR